MVAAGMSAGDNPSELPERIKELRFSGNVFVPNGEYPRNGSVKVVKATKGRKKGQVYIGNVE